MVPSVGIGGGRMPGVVLRVRTRASMISVPLIVTPTGIRLFLGGACPMVRTCAQPVPVAHRTEYEGDRPQQGSQAAVKRSLHGCGRGAGALHMRIKLIRGRGGYKPPVAAPTKVYGFT